MKNNSLLKSLILFFVSLTTLLASAFAWLAISQETSIGKIIGKTADFSAEFAFDVRKNDDEEYMEIDSIEDMHAAFGYTLPGDMLHFKIKIENDGTKDFLIALQIRNLLSAFQSNRKILDPDFDANMLDVYYLKDGEIKITTYEDGQPVVNYEYLTVKSETSVTYFEGTEYEMTLKKHRFSNLVDEAYHVGIISGHLLKIGEEIIIEFSIGYDENTNYPDYEYGEFHLNRIYVYLT
ncbi:hypothetical protein [Acholeplasma hippikon]|uniref:DUF4352 domain-containing protein n=1 Tax=Acholeplasma hippikon TaxID=264636 RepID=A0A449BLL9_9MOLU|nr:hypothetical protein [Acholeplasma hippikon]VEU83331.1 Uncharacterised protein [Acholeplasma hippikon]